MDTVRQALLVIHYRHHSWVWRYSARQATITDPRNLHCLPGVGTVRDRYRRRSGSRNLGLAHNRPLMSTRLLVQEK
jgi:hypothetical protein